MAANTNVEVGQIRQRRSGGPKWEVVEVQPQLDEALISRIVEDERVMDTWESITWLEIQTEVV